MMEKHHEHGESWAQRPVFHKGQKLTAESLNRVYERHAQQLRQAILGIAGVGVVYGFAIETDAERRCRVQNGCIHIGCGLAFDRHGRALFWPGGWISVRQLAGKQPQEPGKYTLWVHYAERRSNRDDDDRCGDDEA